MKERGVISVEASSTFRSYGWITNVTRDATRCPRCGNILYPDAAPGCFDIRVGTPIWERKAIAWFAVEVKYAKTAYSFSDFDDKKRDWGIAHAQSYALWLWLGMGKSIRDKKYPRITYLLPITVFYQLETNATRKSIPYGLPELEQYKLKWNGGGLWVVHDLFLENLVFSKTI